ncbi:MAG TPA: energy transducer TonB [Acidobacteriaceae bacterium]|jgi:TonB family protein|nr:energy transducer TonB [Acidobacteriaceae bacterium]
MRPIVATVIALLSCSLGWAQTPPPAQTPATLPPASIVQLGPPIYPSLARAARVTGDVLLTVTLASDGTPKTVQVESGPPMLRDAATASAQRSKFQPGAGNAPEQRYPVVYRFQLDPPKDCSTVRDPSYPHVKLDQDIVAVTDLAPMLCDPAIDTRRTRSAKCLYLWKCGSKQLD